VPASPPVPGCHADDLCAVHDAADTIVNRAHPAGNQVTRCFCSRIVIGPRPGRSAHFRRSACQPHMPPHRENRAGLEVLRVDLKEWRYIRKHRQPLTAQPLQLCSSTLPGRMLPDVGVETGRARRQGRLPGPGQAHHGGLFPAGKIGTVGRVMGWRSGRAGGRAPARWGFPSRSPGPTRARPHNR